MNGALLGSILCLIFLTGIFTGTPLSSPSEDVSTQPQTVETATAEIITFDTKMEVYRVAGKAFDPYLLSVEYRDISTPSFVDIFQSSGSAMTESYKTQTISLRGDTSVQIYSEDGTTELTCDEIQIGDFLLVARDTDSNEIVRVIVVKNDAESSDLL